MRAAVVVPNWNGRRWLPGLLDSLDAQTRPPDEVIVVDNGSTDGSLELLAERDVRAIALGTNTGFAAAANRGIAATTCEAVALVNTDVVLDARWLEQAVARLEGDPGLAAVATKMVLLDDPGTLDDAGDELRRDGVAHQRGHGRRDDGRWDEPGDAFSACAGAAVYRRAAVEEAGGFDERLFSYLEDVDLGLRLRLAGWRCGYEPALALHGRHGSSGQLERSVDAWVARNTLLLVLKAFPVRWVGPVAYRQLSWIAEAAREGRLAEHLRGLAMAIPHVRAMLRSRRALRRRTAMPIEAVVPRRSWRGPGAGGHPSSSY